RHGHHAARGGARADRPVRGRGAARRGGRAAHLRARARAGRPSRALRTAGGRPRHRCDRRGRRHDPRGRPGGRQPRASAQRRRAARGARRRRDARRRAGGRIRRPGRPQHGRRGDPRHPSAHRPRHGAAHHRLARGERSDHLGRRAARGERHRSQDGRGAAPAGRAVSGADAIPAGAGAAPPPRAGPLAWIVSSAGRPVRAAELRLLPAAGAAWAAGGVLVGFEAGAPYPAIVVALWAAAALAVLGGTRVRALVLVSIALTAAALVATVVAVRAPERVPAAFAEIAGGPAVELDVTVTGAVRDGRVAGHAMPNDRPGAGSASVLLFLEEGSPEPGETWRVRARLVAVAPGDAVSFLAFAEGAAARVGRAPPALAAASTLRAGLLAASETLPGDGARLL